jgi:hypothetical protein
LLLQKLIQQSCTADPADVRTPAGNEPVCAGRFNLVDLKLARDLRQFPRLLELGEFQLRRSTLGRVRPQALDELPAGEWAMRSFPGAHWKQGFEVPKILEEGGVAVQLCNLKTHRFGGHFSASLKNAVGVLAKYSSSGKGYNYMAELHDSPDQRLMIAEASRAFSPAVSIMDAIF